MNTNANIVNNSRGAKKPFNKKKWREERYSHKFKVQQWEERKKKSALRKYKAILKQEGLDPSASSQFNKAELNTEQKFKGSNKKIAQQMKLEEMQKQKEEFERIQQEKKKAIAAYKREKAIKFQKISMKTKKGQPVMKGRLEILCKTLEEQYGKKDN